MFKPNLSACSPTASCYYGNIRYEGWWIPPHIIVEKSVAVGASLVPSVQNLYRQTVGCKSDQIKAMILTIRTILTVLVYWSTKTHTLRSFCVSMAILDQAVADITPCYHTWLWDATYCLFPSSKALRPRKPSQIKVMTFVHWDNTQGQESTLNDNITHT